MKHLISLVLLSGTFCVCFLNPQMLFAQQCQDEEGMAKDLLKDLNDGVDATRKESLSDFEKGYHQKSTLTKLTLSLSMVKEELGCLEKASQDAATAKEQVEAYKTKHEMYAKLASKLEGDHKALKAAEDPKTAKALIEKFDYSK